jgi:formyltetrahydrofolate deformylase
MAGVKLIGATAHLVTRELDSGPIIEQLTTRVSHRDDLGSFRDRSQALEKQCLASAVEYYAEVRCTKS